MEKYHEVAREEDCHKKCQQGSCSCGRQARANASVHVLPRSAGRFR